MTQFNLFMARIHIASILLLILGIVGGISVLTGNLDWSVYFGSMAGGNGLVAIGRGLVATGRNN